MTLPAIVIPEAPLQAIGFRKKTAWLSSLFSQVDFQSPTKGPALCSTAKGPKLWPVLYSV